MDQHAETRPAEQPITAGDVLYDFVGRQKEIKDILDSWKTTKIVVVSGASGIGKFRFVRHVTDLMHERTVERHPIRLQGIRTSRDLRLCFLAEMGVNENVASYANEINARTASSEALHVFLVDNAEDLDAESKVEFLKNCEEMTQNNDNVRILITSRVELPTTDTRIMSIPLPPLSMMEAEQLLKMTSPEVDYGPWLNSIVEVCAGIPDLLIQTASAMAFDQSLDIETYLNNLKKGRVESEEFAAAILSRLSQDEREAIQNVAFLENTFSESAATAVVGDGAVDIDISRSLQEYNIMKVIDFPDEKRFRIDEFIRNYLMKTVDPYSEQITGVRRRFVVFFSGVMGQISELLRSVESEKALRLLSVEMVNLRKLLTRPVCTDADTYHALKTVAKSNSEIIDKYFSDLALHFYTAMHAACIQHSDHYEMGLLALRIGSAYTNIHGKSAEGMAWYDKAEVELLKGGPSDELAMLYQHKGWNYHMQAQKEPAIENLERACEMFKALDLADSRMAMMNAASMGVVYTFHGDLDKGKEFHERSMRLCEALMGQHYSLGSYNNNLGINYRLRGDLENSLKYTQLGLDIKRRYIVGPERSVVLSLNNLAMLYASARNDTDRALAMLDEADEMRKKLPASPLLEALMMDNYCQVHNKRGSFESAVPFGRTAVEVNREHKPRHVMFAESLINCATALYGSGRHEEAYKLLQEALSMREDILKQMPKQYYVFETYKMLVKLTMATGQMDETRMYRAAGRVELERLRLLHTDESNENDLKLIAEKSREFESELKG